MSISSSIFDRRNFLAGALALAAAGCSGEKKSGASDLSPDETPQFCAAPLFPGQRKFYQAPPVPGAPLAGLSEGNAPFVDPGGYKLVHFSASSSNAPLCGPYGRGVAQAAESLRAACDGRTPPVNVVFVYPDSPLPEPDARVPGILNLHAPLETVSALAAKFGLHYQEAGGGYAPDEMAVFLMDPQGRNLFAFNDQALGDTIAGETLEAMKMRRDAAPATPSL